MTRSQPDRIAAVSICDERKGEGRDFRVGVKRGLPPGSAPVSRPTRDFAPCLSIARVALVWSVKRLTATE
jgi:hypothetical protein